MYLTHPHRNLLLLKQNLHLVVVFDFTLNDLQSEFVQDFILNDALERPRAKGRVKAFFGDHFFNKIIYFLNGN